MIKVTTIGVICGNQTKSLAYRLQELGFSNCQVSLHHLELYQARQMKELQGQAKNLRRENDQLWAQIKKSRDLGKDS